VISPIFNRSDVEIAQDIVQALRWNTAVPAEKVRVKVENGNVTLEGEVEWNYQH